MPNCPAAAPMKVRGSSHALEEGGTHTGRLSAWRWSATAGLADGMSLSLRPDVRDWSHLTLTGRVASPVAHLVGVAMGAALLVPWAAFLPILWFSSEACTRTTDNFISCSPAGVYFFLLSLPAGAGVMVLLAARYKVPVGLSMVVGFVGGIGLITLLIAGTGIANTLITAIYERTAEIGLMKAVGATTRQVTTIFLAEAAAIGGAGGGVGLVLGLLISQVVNSAASQSVSAQLGGAGAGNPVSVVATPLWLVLAAPLFATGVGVVAGL